MRLPVETLVQYLGHNISWTDSFAGTRLSIKFTANPAAMVDEVYLEVGGQRAMPVEWRYKLVSVSSPGNASFEMSDQIARAGQIAQIILVIKGQEYKSIGFNWKSTLKSATFS